MPTAVKSVYSSGTSSAGHALYDPTLDGRPTVGSKWSTGSRHFGPRGLSQSHHNLNETPTSLGTSPQSGRGPRRATSWSYVARPMLSRDLTSSSDWTSRMTTATTRGYRTPSTPRIQWGQVDLYIPARPHKTVVY